MIFKLEQVCITYHDRSTIGPVNLSIPEGGKVAITGKSGSGKSSLLRGLLGLASASEGTIHSQDQPLTDTAVTAIRQQVAYIPQEPLLGEGTAEAALLLPFTFRANKGKRPDPSTITSALERLELPASLLNQSVSTLSIGEKQRLCVLRALLLGKRIFILDEITSGLDARSKALVLNAFSDKTFTVISASHDEDWLRGCRVIYDLEKCRERS